MTETELIDRVMVKMEEYTPFAQEALIAAPEVEGFEVRPIRSYIKKELAEACNEMLFTLPLHIIQASPMVILSHLKKENGTGVIGVADDFLRVHTFKMKSWVTPLHSCLREESPEARLQYNHYTMGTPHKPVLVWHKNPLVIPCNNALYYYSCPPSDREREIEFAWQVSAYDPDNIQDDLVDLFATNCAMRVYGIYGMQEQVNNMAAQLKNLIESRV